MELDPAYELAISDRLYEKAAWDLDLAFMGSHQPLPLHDDSLLLLSINEHPSYTICPWQLQQPIEYLENLGQGDTESEEQASDSSLPTPSSSSSVSEQAGLARDLPLELSCHVHQQQQQQQQQERCQPTDPGPRRGRGRPRNSRTLPCTALRTAVSESSILAKRREPQEQRVPVRQRVRTGAERGSDAEKMPPKDHSKIEKRYRDNLDNHIQALQLAVPTLRGRGIPAAIADKQLAHSVLTRGLKSTHKRSKASVYAKAVEYIQHLEEIIWRLHQ